MTRNQRVLVVDDDPNGREGLRALLGLWGFDVDTAGNADEALERLRGREFDIVVTDLALPAGNACDVVRRVRARTGQNCCVIAFSGRHDLRAAAREAGADAFVLKPDVNSLEHLLLDLVDPPEAPARSRRR